MKKMLTFFCAFFILMIQGISLKPSTLKQINFNSSLYSVEAFNSLDIAPKPVNVVIKFVEKGLGDQLKKLTDSISENNITEVKKAFKKEYSKEEYDPQTKYS